MGLGCPRRVGAEKPPEQPEDEGEDFGYVLVELPPEQQPHLVPQRAPRLKLVVLKVIKWLRVRWYWGRVGNWLKKTKIKGVQTRPREGRVWSDLGRGLQHYYGKELFDLVERDGKGTLRFKNRKQDDEFHRKLRRYRRF